jgi:shikimate O-hydroxycinnamoyltransferase
MSQLTRLGCGGVVVAVSLYHLVADGAGLAHFIASWAELARGEAITAPPHLDRACMSARTPPCPSFEHHEYTVHKQPPSYSGAAMEQPPPMTSRIFEFLAQVRHHRAINHFQINAVCRSLGLRKLTSVGCVQDIRVLKERANAEAGSDAYTGFQALAAHLWKHIVKARGTEASEEIKLGWAVDGRKRFHPPLPPHYFGRACNLVQISPVV